MLSICSSVYLFVCLSICHQNAKQLLFSLKLNNLELWCLLKTYRKSYIGFSKNPSLDPSNPRWRRSAILDGDAKIQKGDFLSVCHVGGFCHAFYQHRIAKPFQLFFKKFFISSLMAIFRRGPLNGAVKLRWSRHKSRFLAEIRPCSAATNRGKLITLVAVSGGVC